MESGLSSNGDPLPPATTRLATCLNNNRIAIHARMGAALPFVRGRLTPA